MEPGCSAPPQPCASHPYMGQIKASLFHWKCPCFSEVYAWLPSLVGLAGDNEHSAVLFPSWSQGGKPALASAFFISDSFSSVILDLFMVRKFYNVLVLSWSIEELNKPVIFPSLTKFFLLLRGGRNGGVKFAFRFYVLFLLMELFATELRDRGSFQHRTLIDIACVTERKGISWRLMAS